MKKIKQRHKTLWGDLGLKHPWKDGKKIDNEFNYNSGEKKTSDSDDYIMNKSDEKIKRENKLNF